MIDNVLNVVTKDDNKSDNNDDIKQNELIHGYIRYIYNVLEMMEIYQIQKKYYVILIIYVIQ